MSGDPTIYWGVDCGSAEIKVVACDRDGRVLYQHKCKTLFPLEQHVRAALAGSANFPGPLEKDGSVLKGHHLTATGYGRTHLPFIEDKLTEIKAHYLGVQHVLGAKIDGAYTVIDIGGQDSKVITVENKSVGQFAINRKCAAGTGAFIEELAHRLELNLSDLPRLEKKHDKVITLNSYCTVFAATEVIKILMHGEKVENLIHALYESVVKRILEMTVIQTDTVVFSGGVLTHHTSLHDIFKKRLGAEKTYWLVPHAQFAGALGAALHGRRSS